MHAEDEVDRLDRLGRSDRESLPAILVVDPAAVLVDERADARKLRTEAEAIDIIGRQRLGGRREGVEVVGGSTPAASSMSGL